METQAREMMERQSERLVDYPDVQAKVKAHLAETEGQMKRLEDCPANSTRVLSSLKDTAQSFMGNLAAMAHATADDEILKNTLANNAFENYEIAAYRSLLAMCGPRWRGQLQARARGEPPRGVNRWPTGLQRTSQKSLRLTFKSSHELLRRHFNEGR